VRELDDVDPAEKRIAEQCQIRLVATDDPLRRVVEPVDVDPAAMEIERQEPAAQVVGPARFVGHHHAAGVGVAAAMGIGPAVARFGPVARGVEVLVVGVRRERVGHERMRLDGVRSGVVRSGEETPQVAVDGVDEKPLATVVPVVAPGVGGAVADRFEHLPLRMVAPHSTTQGDTGRGSDARRPDRAG